MLESIQRGYSILYFKGYSFTSRFLISIIGTRSSTSYNPTGNSQILGSADVPYLSSIFKILSAKYSIIRLFYRGV